MSICDDFSSHKSPNRWMASPPWQCGPSSWRLLTCVFCTGRTVLKCLSLLLTVLVKLCGNIGFNPLVPACSRTKKTSLAGYQPGERILLHVTFLPMSSHFARLRQILASDSINKGPVTVLCHRSSAQLHEGYHHHHRWFRGSCRHQCCSSKSLCLQCLCPKCERKPSAEATQ